MVVANNNSAPDYQSSSRNNTKSTSARDFTDLKKEVDALQIAVMSSKTPWYKNTSTMISVLALLFSFGTTYVSYVRVEQQDIRESRIELRGLLQRMAALPKEQIELNSKYSHDQDAVSRLGGYINQENSILSRQAVEIINKIPTNQISASEYMSVANSLEYSYNNQLARQFYSKAIDASNNINDKVAAFKGRANNLFNTGEATAGRVDFQAALNIFPNNDMIYSEYVKKSIHIWTEISWAYAEANINRKPEALQHVAAAKAIIATMATSPGVQQLDAYVRQAEQTILSNGTPVVPAVVAPPVPAPSP